MSQKESSARHVLGEIREVTRNLRRRYVLYYLTQRQAVVDFDELVERIASWESGRPPELVSDRTLKSVYSSLYQTHLPLLEERGLVAFDRDAKTVSVTEKTSDVTLQFRADPRRRRRWSIAYLGLGFVGLSTLGLQFVGAISTTVLVYWMSAVLGAFTVLVLYTQYRQHRTVLTDAPDYVLRIDERSL